MYGKVVKISEYELKFGGKEQNINIFICFKSLKNGNSYLIYSFVGQEATGVVYYGLLHMEKQKIISMEPKSGDSEIIKEVVWKLINKEDMSNYEIITIGDRDKLEIIGNSSLNMKPQVVNSLIDLTIPKKKVEVQDGKDNRKKINPALKILGVVAVLAIIVAGYITYTHLGKYLGYGTTVTCVKSYRHDVLDADVDETITIDYDRNDKFEKLIDNKAYTFDEYDVYFEFKEKGEYFHYEPEGKPAGGTKFEDENSIFRTIANIGPLDDYTVGEDKVALPKKKSEDIKLFTKNKYTCTSKDREE